MQDEKQLHRQSFTVGGYDSETALYLGKGEPLAKQPVHPDAPELCAVF